MLQNLIESQIDIRPIEKHEICLFKQLASTSNLCSLKDSSFVQELVERGHIMAAFCRDQPIGCSCLQVDVRREYISLEGGLKCSLPPSNVYLCSTFVQPEYRRSGVGLRLYAERLRMAQSFQTSMLAVEILGRGVPLTIEAIVRVGYNFHLEAGFRIAGYSLEIDHGPVLVRPNKSALPQF